MGYYGDICAERKLRFQLSEHYLRFNEKQAGQDRLALGQMPVSGKSGDAVFVNEINGARYA